jgi:hypothetical protein
MTPNGNLGAGRPSRKTTPTEQVAQVLQHLMALPGFTSALGHTHGEIRWVEGDRCYILTIAREHVIAEDVA